MNKFFTRIALVATLSALMPIAAFAESMPEGTWAMNKKKVTVQVAFCGGKNLCATIVGLAKPISNIDGKPKVDRENPNKALRSRPLMGLVVMNGMVPAGEDTWKGKIYNADDGGTYRATMKLVGDKMVVKGCWGPFCKDMNFSRIK
jgi:uncharacterized protein (DUF2147 family)